MYRVQGANVIIALLCLSGTVLALPQSYSVIDCGQLSPLGSTVNGINNAGCIVGTKANQAFVWSQQGGMQILPGYNNGSSFASGLNDSGVIVGWAKLAGSSYARAAAWENGGWRSLGDVGYGSSASDINSAGVIVGSIGISNGERRPVVWTSSGRTILEQVNGWASAVNEEGHIAGGVYHHPRWWKDGATLPLKGMNVNDIGANANDINDDDQIVGVAQSQGEYQGSIWHDGAVTFIPRLYGLIACAQAVNNSGVVVGYLEPAGTMSGAFIWEDGVTYDLNLLGPSEAGWFIDSAADINENGQIAALARDDQQNWHAVMLNPVPEPASVLCLIALPLLKPLRKRRV